MELLFSEDLQEDTFNEDHNSLFSGDADNLSLEFVPAAGGAEAHFLLKRIGNDNVLVKVETDAAAFTAATVFNLATATQFDLHIFSSVASDRGVLSDLQILGQCSG